MQTSIPSPVSAEPVTLDEPLPLLSDRNSESRRPRFETSEEDFARTLLIILVPIVLAEALLHAVSKGLWFDELLTVIVSRQPHVAGIWNFLTHGVDGHPPGMYLVERLMGKLGGNERITLRLVPIAAFISVMLSMFVFIRRRVGGVVALISAFALLLTIAFDPLAFEARSYGLMVAAIAVALLCYDRADSIIGALLFGLSLAAATSLHFYAVFAFCPFGLAELAYVATQRKIRTQVWAGFVAGMLPYLAFWPILNVQRVLYGAHFWAKPTFWNLARSLGEMLQMTTSFSFGLYVAAIVYLLYSAITGRIGARPANAPGPGFALPDIILTMGFLGIPTVTWIGAEIAHGGMTGRYLVTATLGISLALGLLLSRLERPAIFSVGIFLLCMFVFQEGAFWKYVLRPHENRDPMQVSSQVSKDLNVPVVISNGLVFLPVWYHADDSLKSHLVFLADPEELNAVSGTDTPALILITLKNHLPIHVESFPEFSRIHRKFLLYSSGDALDYWPRWLLQRGYSLRAIDIEGRTATLTEEGPDPSKAIVYLVDLDGRQ